MWWSRRHSPQADGRLPQAPPAGAPQSGGNARHETSGAEEHGVRVVGVQAKYGAHVALNDMTVSIQPGRVTALIGTNGSGKSTLFAVLTGELEPSAGSVRVLGLPPAIARRRGLIAFVPQNDSVDWTFPLSVRDVVMMGRYGRLGITRRPGRDDWQRVASVIADVGLDGLDRRQIGQLSGGQRRRVFVARGLVQESPVLLLDEPFAGVDVASAAILTRVIQDAARSGVTVFVSTHDLASVGTLADTAVLINRELIASGDVESVLAAENLARAFGADPSIRAEGE